MEFHRDFRFTWIIIIIVMIQIFVFILQRFIQCRNLIPNTISGVYNYNKSINELKDLNIDIENV
jgi:hypothetical protein